MAEFTNSEKQKNYFERVLPDTLENTLKNVFWNGEAIPPSFTYQMLNVVIRSYTLYMLQHRDECLCNIHGNIIAQNVEAVNGKTADVEATILQDKNYDS